MKKRTSYLIIAIVIVVGLILDLVTKHIFADMFKGGREDIVVIPNFFRFTYLENKGAAYGIFAGSTWGLTIVSILFIIGFFVFDYFYHNNDWLYLLGFGFIISGAIGNLVDRLFLQYVRDFISIEIFSFVFNLADLFITIGAILSIVYLLIKTITESKEKKEKEHTDELDNK